VAQGEGPEFKPQHCKKIFFKKFKKTMYWGVSQDRDGESSGSQFKHASEIALQKCKLKPH
jgi:hypothetical protein